MFYFIQNVAFIGQNLWLSDWTEDSVEYFNTTYPPNIRDMRIVVFGALGLAQGMSRKRFKKYFHKKYEMISIYRIQYLQKLPIISYDPEQD